MIFSPPCSLDLLIHLMYASVHPCYIPIPQVVALLARYVVSFCPEWQIRSKAPLGKIPAAEDRTRSSALILRSRGRQSELGQR